jgi:ribosomal protein S19
MKTFQLSLFERLRQRRAYLKSVIETKTGGVYILRIKDKTAIITAPFYGHLIGVYDGRGYKRVYIYNDTYGHRFGEFIETKHRGRDIHISERNAKKARKMYMKSHGLMKKQRRTKA